ncbi:hypothetical protein [Burkholderia sp. JKS000303]|uniref:hypothetical protein n=1 Tax=Burkholderia sp. JKS000303 TaxID=1938747 RepID=UPI0011812C49|nr:hypothetical protein [Burkholderia sp. JKS000303]
MGKEKPDLHDLISELQDHLVATREAFVALTHALTAQQALDVDLLRAELESSRCHLEKSGERKAASVLGEMSAGLLDDLSLRAMVLQGRRARDEARKRRQTDADGDPLPQRSTHQGSSGSPHS